MRSGRLSVAARGCYDLAIQMNATKTVDASGPGDLSNCRWLISGDHEQRLRAVVEMMREVSRQTDPQQMVQAYSRRVRQILPADGSLSLSRRDLVHPYYRITRSSRWHDPPDPWKSPQRLPLLKGGLLAELIYGEEPRVIDELQIGRDDPAAEYLQGHRSLVAIPLFDSGRALNMVVLLYDQPNAYCRQFLPEHTWMSNLFGRATHNLVLSEQLRQAYETVDRELQIVADIQRSLLPVQLPQIPTLEIAAHYQTSRRAGGDYYDFFALPDGRWGILIADVAGHGTPAAVMMAVTHSIAHTHHEPPEPPSKLLNFINRHLAARYTSSTGTFVTAFYGIYDPGRRMITYANAGHPPPRHRRAGSNVLGSLQGQANLPLGIEIAERYVDCTQQFDPGDAIIFYTDGITEARSASGLMFGFERLDQVLLAGDSSARQILNRTIAAVEQFTDSAPPSDDRTLLVARVT